jgi:hypothetical protein
MSPVLISLTESDSGATPPPRKTYKSHASSEAGSSTRSRGVASPPDSPSRNTRSRAAQSRDAMPIPDSPSTNARSHKSIVITEPTKRRKGNCAGQSDIDVWDLTDAEIICTFSDSYILTSAHLCAAAARAQWKSKVYDHYSVSLVRDLRPNGTPGSLCFKFECRCDPVKHHAQFRQREKTASGTSNLDRTAKACNERRGLGKPEDTSKGAQQTLGNSISTYSEAKHRALIALRCASSHRPFRSVKDPFYVHEVEMLRPGTKLPSPSTVSRDVCALYDRGAHFVKDYFAVSTVCDN